MSAANIISCLYWTGKLHFQDHIHTCASFSSGTDQVLQMPINNRQHIDWLTDRLIYWLIDWLIFCNKSEFDIPKNLDNFWSIYCNISCYKVKKFLVSCSYELTFSLSESLNLKTAFLGSFKGKWNFFLSRPRCHFLRTHT